jgi:holliday junction DNA helicase RuvA
MIFLRGKVHHVGATYVILEREGLGHKIIVPETAGFNKSGEVELYIHEVIREHERELFGFVSVEQLEFFWKLIGVSGVGPKSGQKIAYTDKVASMKAKIMGGDLSCLTSVSGIGKKTAQKIILELKGALAKEPDAIDLDLDSVEALVGLGYSRRDAQDALSGLEETDTDDRIRAALKRLARK